MIDLMKFLFTLSFLNNTLIISHLYFDLFKFFGNKKEFKINQDTIIEFLWFNRVFGTETYDNLSSFMEPANIMHVSNEQTNNIKYWKPDFRKTKLSKEAGKNFISLLKSLFRLTSDKKRLVFFYQEDMIVG